MIPDTLTDEQLLALFIFWLAVCYHPKESS
jgi:hypothetical protein